jgi:hypothetical protein
MSSPATGQAFHNQTCVHIRWPFLTYPAVLVLLAITFFVCMVFGTGRGDNSRHDWKSSQLALLFHGLDRKALKQKQLSLSVSAKEMERVAAEIFVCLDETDSGWKLVSTQDGSKGKEDNDIETLSLSLSLSAYFYMSLPNISSSLLHCPNLANCFVCEVSMNFPIPLPSLVSRWLVIHSSCLAPLLNSFSQSRAAKLMTRYG